MLGQTSEAGGGIILIVSWQGAAQGDQGTSWEHDGAACMGEVGIFGNVELLK